MFRCVCLFVLLPLCVLGQADVLLSTPSKSFIFPTDQPNWEETHAPTVPPTTEGPANAVTEVVNTTTVAPTTLPTTQPTNSTTAPPTTQPTNSTTAPPTTQPTNSTTAPPTTQPTNSTTAPPTTQPANSTTAPPTTQPANSTTAPPTTQPANSTTAPPTTLPTNFTTASTPAPTTPPLPEVGDYVVRAEWNSSACLMARMGLQFSFRMGDSFQTINLDPNVTVTNGTCGNNGSDSALMLTSDKISVHFTFSNQTSKFFLSALNLTVVAGSGTSFTAASTNLSLWEASLGSSYMCRKEQSFNITDALILNTFELHVQPFGVTNDKFSTAEDCKADEAGNFIVPIAVGVALIVLVLLVLVAYFIGRQRSRVTSYEQFR
ncbi:lysosome-associated membrane glycoprotein 2 isoform X1 [Pangasianodon hypophthalmus]|uniref:lysosome-associated membrane glycoprotein 2 isoform X1 n=1 Tax=Pangasianodon hypophthalmus TaxID=310915 RepID=UPI0023076A6E|nr:lysosome-associated membrane glycoprotein 2 isoform X1 [Pangasianodon hypophthalmus]